MLITLCASSLAVHVVAHVITQTITLSSAVAHPDQLWEDYVLAPNARSWVESLPLKSPERAYFEILNDQAQGDLERARQTLKRAKDDQISSSLLETLQARQLVLELTQGSPAESWDALASLGRLSSAR